MTPHTTSLEVAEQLTAVCREKGIEIPESYFSWYLVAVDGPDVAQTWLMKTSKKWNRDCNDKCPAFTLGELMRMLPEGTLLIRPLVNNEWGYKSEDKWQCADAHGSSNYICMDSHFIDTDLDSKYGSTPEDAAALLLIELIKSGEITCLHVSA